MWRSTIRLEGMTKLIVLELLLCRFSKQTHKQVYY